MTAIDLNQAKSSVDRVFQSALDGEEVIITEDEIPVLRLTRIKSSVFDTDENNALEKIRNIRISGAHDLSVNADLYANGNKDE